MSQREQGYVCGDFHPDAELPNYCEGCTQPKSAHAPELVRTAAKPDGSLDLRDPHIAFDPGDARILLRGYFSALELRALTAHMERVGTREPWPDEPR